MPAVNGNAKNDLINVGGILLYCDNNDNLNEFKFRYMIIPGGVATSEVNQGYEHVAGKFGITP